jgi:single-stranded DNA-binding protein|nr:MAG TPA: Single strand binding protein [Caudoviricetes sp.]
MTSANITIQGFLGAAPEVRYTADGLAVANLSIAHTPRKRDPQTDEWVDAGPTLWVVATVWGAVAEAVADTSQKGDLVAVSGQLTLDEWTDADGVVRTDLAIRSATYLGTTPRQKAVPAKPARTPAKRRRP